MVTTPAYGKWCDRKLWTIHESICLVLAIEPDTVRHDPSTAAIGGFDPLTLAIEQYGERADEAMRSGALVPFSVEDLSRPPLQRRVEPRAFLQCAKSWNIPIPDELAVVLTREPTRQPV